VQNTTKMQFLMLQAHEINVLEEQSRENNPNQQKEQQDKIWEEKLKKSQERSLQRQKTKEEILKSLEDEIAEQIKERDNASS